MKDLQPHICLLMISLSISLIACIAALHYDMVWCENVNHTNKLDQFQYGQRLAKKMMA